MTVSDLIARLADDADGVDRLRAGNGDPAGVASAAVRQRPPTATRRACAR